MQPSVIASNGAVSGKSATETADVLGVSARTIERTRAVLASDDEDTKAKLLNGVMPVTDDPGVEVTPLNYDDLHDPELAGILQRCEQRILSHTQDVLDGWLGMAGEFHKARVSLTGHDIYSLRVENKSKRGRPYSAEPWREWVARFDGIVSLTTADNLARIGALETSELETLRSTLFAKSGGISGIAKSCD